MSEDIPVRYFIRGDDGKRYWLDAKQLDMVLSKGERIAFMADGTNTVKAKSVVSFKDLI